MKYANMLNGIPHKAGIYVWYNKVNDKCYVGQASDLYRRTYEHLTSFKSNKQHKYLYNAMNKYGIENFEVLIVKSWSVIDKALLDEQEKYYIKRYNCLECGYNLTEGGDGASGYDMSEETRQHLRETSIKARQREREEGKFSFFCKDLEKNKLYKFADRQVAAIGLNIPEKSINRGISTITVLRKRFVLAKTLEDLHDKLDWLENKGTYTIEELIEYIKAHPDECNLDISKKFYFSEYTIRYHKEKLGIEKHKIQILKLTKGEDVFIGNITQCSLKIGVSSSMLYRKLDSLINTIYKGWLIELLC